MDRVAQRRWAMSRRQRAIVSEATSSRPVAAELASLDDDELAELIEGILAAAAGRRGLESIALASPSFRGRT